MAVCNLLVFFLSVWIELITIAFLLPNFITLVCVTGNCDAILG